jgi:sugar/nucleoside kinase (ribokinase family)
MERIFSDNPTIAVVGHLVKDEIITAGGEIKTALGGIAYNLATLGAIIKRGRILPVCRIGNDFKELANSLVGSTIFDMAMVRFMGRPNVVNRLIYKSDGSRDEWNSRRAAPLDISGLEKRADAVFLNFISGKDVKLSDLKKFRAKYRGLIYCDFHSLSLGFDKNHKRYHRRHPYWREYLSACDIVQMNILELASIYGRKLEDQKAIKEAGEMLLEAGPGVVIITAGRRGVYLLTKGSDEYYFVPPVKIGPEIDPTGCGDVLGIAFFLNFLEKGNLVQSLEIANRLAAAKATFSGLGDFARIEDIASNLGPAPKACKCKPDKTSN